MATEIYLGYPPENIRQWIKENYKPAFKLTDPLCFTAEEPNATLYFNKDYSEYNNQVVFSYDKQNWSSYEYGTEITLANVGDKVYFKATDDFENWTFNDYRFNINNGKIAASGNINTLLKADGSINDLTIDSVDRSYCYAYMFSDCTSLTEAPELPATTLASDCYSGMFYNCKSLTQAPELPATTLVDNCYSGMFEGCSSLTKAPELPATTLAYSCYENMFTYCKSLTQAPELPATTLVDNCYSGMFYNCKSLTQAPELPATTLVDNCYNYMFYNCKSPFTFPDKTFDEVANLIQEENLIGDYWYYYDEDGYEIIINPVEIICSDKTMLASVDEDEWTWILTEK